jgi:hypothetical protein
MPLRKNVRFYDEATQDLSFSSSLLPPSLSAMRIEFIHVPFPAGHYPSKKEHFNDHPGLIKQNDNGVFILDNKHIGVKKEDLSPNFFHSYNCMV